MTQTVLVLGPTGRFGRNICAAFQTGGWNVRKFVRGDDLLKAATGADVIVNGWNPAYPDWKKDVPGLTAQVITAARASGATVIIPGNVYPFGATAPDRLDESTPHRATNPLGLVRTEMEAAFRDAGVSTIILRAGDFIDNEPSGNWFDKIITPKCGAAKFVYPGDPTVPHAWAYLPDMARAAVELAAMRDQLPHFADIPFPGYTLTGNQMADLVGRALNKPQNVSALNWWVIHALRPVWPMARGLAEMSYLWTKPHYLSGDLFDRLLPDFKATLPENAVAVALEINVHPDKAVA